jgi:predicted ribosome quality control (RQC) complex YloA/Tae2 family protein
MDALTQFARLNLAHLHFTKQKSAVLQIIKAQLKRTEALIYKTDLQLQQEQETLSPEQKGHLIMANLHILQTGMDKATLHDFYHNQAVEIKLKKDLSPQENAAYYYRKNRNKKIETIRLQEKLSSAHVRLVLLQTNLDEASRAADIKSLKPYLKEQKQKEDVLPFKVFMCEGFTIWVGKNAVNNDLLTTRYANKNDLWLHAKDAPGSHVIIKHRSGHVYPKALIETAASWAAYFSKRKTEGLVPVAYTPCKYVRKRKGDPPGAVVVEREETVLVPPLAP